MRPTGAAAVAARRPVGALLSTTTTRSTCEVAPGVFLVHEVIEGDRAEAGGRFTNTAISARCNTKGRRALRKFEAAVIKLGPAWIRGDGDGWSALFEGSPPCAALGAILGLITTAPR